MHALLSSLHPKARFKKNYLDIKNELRMKLSVNKQEPIVDYET